MLYTPQTQYVRPKSRAAYWSLAIARFAFFVFLLALGLHYFLLLEEKEFFLLLGFTILCAFIALILAFIGLFFLWKEGAQGGFKTIKALLYCCAILVPAGIKVFLMFYYPPLYDISTDLENPPVFSSQTRPQDALVLAPSLKGQEHLQKQFWPLLRHREYEASLGRTLEAVMHVLAEKKWQNTVLPQQKGQDLYIEALAKGFVWHFPSDIILRLHSEGNKTLVDMRASSRYFTRDMGQNAHYILSFISALDKEILH